MKCNLPEDINTCPFYNKDKKECMNTDNKCSFQERKDEAKNNVYVRKERWYEKYYK